MGKTIDKSSIQSEAWALLQKELHEQAVQEEVEKLRKKAQRKSFWRIIFPWKITIERVKD